MQKKNKMMDICARYEKFKIKTSLIPGYLD